MYNTEKDKDRVVENLDDVRELAKHSMFSKGQSKRIWNELFKVSINLHSTTKDMKWKEPLEQ